MAKKAAKTILTSFTFYFIFLSLLTIYTHYSGGDSKSIGLIWLNPILNNLCYTDFADNVLMQGPIIKVDTIAGEISVYWYVAHLITFIFYGAVLDGFKALIKLLLRKCKPEKSAAAQGNAQ
jgi:hypothetical protein